VYVIIIDLKSMGTNIRQRQPVEPRFLQVNDPLARQTYKMMVLAKRGIEASRRPLMTHLGDHSRRHQRIEDAVDRGSGHIRKPGFHPGVDLVCSRVVFPTEHHLQYDAALYCQGHAALAADPLELLHAYVNGFPLHILPIGKNYRLE
jgi:hypothetical protein